MNHHKIPRRAMPAEEAYQLISQKIAWDGIANKNMATFCQTSMEQEAKQLIVEALNKNSIDKSEYPMTSEVEQNCVDIIANLWHAPSDFIGTSTIGSSEGAMLAGLALKFRWEAKMEALGVEHRLRTPNIIISSTYQICWKKFSTYFDVELRQVPISQEHDTLDISILDQYIDADTIGIVGILGNTYHGKYDDIKALDEFVSSYNQAHQQDIKIHIDAASGGLYSPFIEPDLLWDFRLDNVHSINTSGHKYGLVYPGVGWVVWRTKADFPEKLIFYVSYLGGKHPTIAINFSRSASQIIGQYYNFVRFGFEGYKRIHEETREAATILSAGAMEFGIFDIIHDGQTGLPVVCWKLKANVELSWSLYDLTDCLFERGWQVPTYAMPHGMTDTIVQRIVCRANFKRHDTRKFLQDLADSINDLHNGWHHTHAKLERHRSHGFKS